ncbi:phage holin family protein [Massilia sp. LXY-6]|uniref:phage holin family protein n=1 Tax=Massilia sp. LXY-6 TaxID=3379823 RepID=UPI003EE25728
MALFATAGRIASTLVAMVGTRLELAAVEFQEDARRLLGYLAWSMLAVFLAAGAVMLVALFVILLFWDTYRLQAVAAMAAVLGLGAFLIVSSVRSRLNAQTPLFATTLAELRKDIAYVRHAAAGANAGEIDE